MILSVLLMCCAGSQAKPEATKETDSVRVGVNSAPLNRHLVVCTKKSLFYDTVNVADLIINDDDGKEDFPDSIYNNFYIEPLKRLAEQSRKGDDSTQFILQFDSNLTFATIKPVVRALANSGVSRASLLLGSEESIEIELYNQITNTYATHSGDDDGMYAVILLRLDSFFVFDNTTKRNPNLVTRGATANKQYLSQEELTRLGSAISNLQKRNNGVRWIGVEPHPYTKLSKVFQVFREINFENASGKKQKLEPFIIGIFSPWKREKALIKKQRKRLCDSIRALPAFVGAIPEYPPQELRRSIMATVEAEIVLDPIGKLEKYTIIKSGGKSFDLAVSEAIEKTQFPIQCIDNEPARVRFRKKYNFELTGKKSAVTSN